MNVPELSNPPGAGWRIERPLRLTTGLILFSYVTAHLINSAFGIRSIEAMEVAALFLLQPWQTTPALLLLYSSFFIHGALGLWAFYRRRHLRIPAAEAWRLALGLAIPLLLISHAGGIRVGASVYDIQHEYLSVLYLYWVDSPDYRAPRQLLLIMVAWLHACISLRIWLRTKAWYPPAKPALAALAVVVPVLAVIGFITAGLDIRDAVARDPALAMRYAPPPPGSEVAQSIAARDRIVAMLWYGYLGLVGVTFALRALRNWHAKRFRAVRITYPGARVVTVPAGFSILEASWWSGIPHASVCGGRARCSTCRVRVVRGGERLEPPGGIECATLTRIGNPPQVRLACQLRPAYDIAVEPLIPVSASMAALAARFEPAVEGGRELTIAAMFVDLRESTRLAAGRLPYDALFLADRYVQAVTNAIRANDGHVTSIAGDGVMSMFGIDGDAAGAARSALRAALQVWMGLDELNAGLAHELETPLRFGIGIHVGVAVVGWLHGVDSRSLQFLGDTGNVAAKLEAETKQLECTLVASVAALELVDVAVQGLVIAPVSIAGKAEPITVAVFRSKDDLTRIVRS
jgi:adenylate cyclase